MTSRNNAKKKANLNSQENVLHGRKKRQSNLRRRATRSKQIAAKSASILEPHDLIRAEIDAFAKQFEEAVASGWNAYLLSFMYRQISASREEILARFTSEVERVYYRLQKRTVRNGNQKPRFYCAPDRTKPGEMIASGFKHHGIHCHAAVLVPPDPRFYGDLVAHINAQSRQYVPPRGLLMRLHCQPFKKNPGRAVEYALEGLHEFGRDALVVLPAAKGEAKHAQAS